MIGADGLHSAVRRLAFGPERDYVRSTGLHVAITPLGEPVDDPHDVPIYNTPDRLVSIHPARDKALVAFIFRGANGFAYRDMKQHKRIVSETYADAGWRVPQLLERLRATEDLYFDAVGLVDLPAWSKGRITLAGDAGSCVSLLGDGSSLAIAGAHTLATALADRPADHAAPFGQYETVHRARITPKQRAVNCSAALLVSKTRFGLAARHLAARLWPGSI